MWWASQRRGTAASPCWANEFKEWRSRVCGERRLSADCWADCRTAEQLKDQTNGCYLKEGYLLGTDVWMRNTERHKRRDEGKMK